MQNLSILRIYQQYSIPLNLAQHMLQAAALGNLILDSWQGSGLDRQLLISTLLVHDIGNLVKFDLNSSPTITFQHTDDVVKIPQLLQLRTIDDSDYWLRKQKEMRDKYSSHADQANRLIVKELGLDPRINRLLEHHSLQELTTLLHNDNWQKKIVLYADMRVAPSGLTNLTARIKDLRRRYRQRDLQWQDEQTYQQWLDMALQLEAQLNQHASLDLATITTNQLTPHLEQVGRYQLEVGV